MASRAGSGGAETAGLGVDDRACAALGIDGLGIPGSGVDPEPDRGTCLTPAAAGREGAAAGRIDSVRVGSSDGAAGGRIDGLTGAGRGGRLPRTGGFPRESVLMNNLAKAGDGRRRWGCALDGSRLRPLARTRGEPRPPSRDPARRLPYPVGSGIDVRAPRLAERKAIRRAPPKAFRSLTGRSMLPLRCACGVPPFATRQGLPSARAKLGVHLVPRNRSRVIAAAARTLRWL